MKKTILLILGLAAWAATDSKADTVAWAKCPPNYPLFCVNTEYWVKLGLAPGLVWGPWKLQQPEVTLSPLMGQEICANVAYEVSGVMGDYMPHYTCLVKRPVDYFEPVLPVEGE